MVLSNHVSNFFQSFQSSSAATASLALPPELANSILQQATFGSGTVINIQSAQPQESVVRHTSSKL